MSTIEIDLRMTPKAAYALAAEIEAATGKEMFVTYPDGRSDQPNIGTDPRPNSGKPGGDLLWEKAQGLGKWGVLDQGWPIWILNPAAPKPDPQPASGAGLLADQNTGKTVFGGDISGAQNSDLAALWSNVQLAVARFGTAAKEKGVL